MRHLTKLMLCTVLLFCSPSIETQAAEQYPIKPIMCILPTETGSDLDTLSRPLIQKASAIIGKPFIPVNKPGAGSTIGYREIYDAKPDGYTIGVATITMMVTRLQGLLPVDYRDYTLFGTYYRMNAIVVGATRSKRPFKTIQEAISFAKANPGELSIASAAVGNVPWMGVMALVKGTGIEANVIPQPGGTGMAIVQVAGGHMDLSVTFLAAAKPQIEAGNVRILAVMGDERAPGYENVPTLKELGYDIACESAGFVVGPPKIPKNVTDRLAAVLKTAATDPEYHKFLLDRFAMPFYIPPDQIIPYVDRQRVVVRGIMEKAGILKEK